MNIELLEAQKIMESLDHMVKQYSKQYISPKILRKIYRQYSKWCDIIENRDLWWRSQRDIRRIHAFSSYLVHYLLERCYWLQYGDSEMVAHLLSNLYELDGSLGKIFHLRIFSRDRRSSFGNKSESDSDEEEDHRALRKYRDEYFYTTTWKTEVLAAHPVTPAEYFMGHAYKHRLTFGSKRFAEQDIVCSVTTSTSGHPMRLLYLPPCSLSSRFPELLLRLLQVGLFARAAPDDADVGKLLTAALGMCASRCLLRGDCGYAAAVLRAARALLRAVERVQPGVLARTRRFRLRLKEVPRLAAALRGYVPMLAQRCAGPQELAHLCRCAVRRRLYDNWQLPGGIGFLPVPRLMKSYLRLELD